MSAHSGVFARFAPAPPKPPRQSRGRGGRDLKKAVPVALALVGLVIVSVVFYVQVFVALAAVVLCFAVWEVAGAFLNRGVRIFVFPLYLGVLGQVAATWWAGLMWGLAAYGGTALLHFAWTFVWTQVRLRRGNESTVFPARRGAVKRQSGAAELGLSGLGIFETAAAGAFVAAWVGLLGCFAVALARGPQPALFIILLILMPAANDTGGWAAGIVFGKHALAPRISPKKTWEGLAGSFVLSWALALVLVMWLLHGAWWLALLTAVAAVVCATLGDISESLLKRDLGVKDMGSVFPGHGGMMDRLDSILMWAPFCYLIIAAVYGAL